MYKFLLTFRYLRRKLIPWFALLAVTLCTAMVMIVGSIMGGFLNMVTSAGKTVMGDVMIASGAEGIPYYDEVLESINQLPEAKASTAIISTIGLLRLDVLGNEYSYYVEILGIDGRSYADVTGYADTLYWSVDRMKEQSYYSSLFQSTGPLRFDPHEAGLDLVMPGRTADAKPDDGIVLGMEISPTNDRTVDGTYTFNPPILGFKAMLTVQPVSRKAMADLPSVKSFVVVNEFHSGFYLVDSRRVYVPFAALQKMLHMESAPKLVVDEQGLPVLNDDGTPKTEGSIPQRCTEIQVAAEEGFTSDALRDAVEKVYYDLAQKHHEMPYNVNIVTWQQRQRQYIAAVEHEKGLLIVLFGIISLVAVAMVAVIFYMIVLEKTRDIGILRSLGASRMGIASIFLWYGAGIGALGATIGGVLAYFVITYINEIHAWLGRNFHIVIWDKSVYFFDRIPNQLDWKEAGWVFVIAIVSSIIGALIPALLAARLDPVEALRYE